MTQTRQLHLQYFALFREQAKCSHETVITTATTAQALYAELAARHGFSLAATQLKVAINGEFAQWQHALNDGDQVAFIPPVAGG